MATVEEVEAVINDLADKLESLDPTYRAMLPSRRTIQATCPDLDLVVHAIWRNGRLSEVRQGPAPRADIRITCDSDDLLKLANRELAFGHAYATNRVQVHASMTDLLRLRAVI